MHAIGKKNLKEVANRVKITCVFFLLSDVKAPGSKPRGCEEEQTEKKGAVNSQTLNEKQLISETL